ncbi:conserved exported hypothetical protein [Hyella patelloides LEGE 07179]|uniref:Uncharacterized protein n=1 Tax=Hyella patelloides LEGE 07179 TaxID=945734 RepID=A0A563VL98_9CYAN|nr:hypothetical protein [Hyella patelloides]VEP12226.1 conserved exported hypothetical protein [Hyella patelloides LEGE 07179]
MFTSNKWFLAGLVIIAGEIAAINPSNANGFNHDTTSIPTNQSLVDTSVPSNGINGSLDSDTGVLTVEGLGSTITLSPDIIQSIQDISGVSGGETITGNADTLSSDSSNTVTICFSDPCVPSGEGTRAISLNDLAELIENDLQNSLNELAAAEAVEQRASNQPRKFVRRRSANCVNPAIQARQTVEKKLEESQKFVEQVDQLNPENSIW